VLLSDSRSGFKIDVGPLVQIRAGRQLNAAHKKNPMKSFVVGGEGNEKQNGAVRQMAPGRRRKPVISLNRVQIGQEFGFKKAHEKKPAGKARFLFHKFVVS